MRFDIAVRHGSKDGDAVRLGSQPHLVQGMEEPSLITELENRAYLAGGAGTPKYMRTLLAATAGVLVATMMAGHQLL